MKKILLTVSVIFLSLVLVYSGFNIGKILLEYRKGDAEYESLESEYVSELQSEDPASSPEDSGQPDTVPEDYSDNVTESDSAAPISVNFEALLEQNSDVQGWIYSKDTPINYPIARADDNDTYLRHTLSGKYNIAGTLFVDYRNSEGFRDLDTVVYGHNLKNTEMFGTIVKYQDQSYYEEHPTMWLLTPEHTYRLDVFAGFTTDSSGWPYHFDLTEDGLADFLSRAYGSSDFTSDVDKSDITQILTLSTCSYEYDDARYVVLCSMVEVD